MWLPNHPIVTPGQLHPNEITEAGLCSSAFCHVDPLSEDRSELATLSTLQEALESHPGVRGIWARLLLQVPGHNSLCDGTEGRTVPSHLSLQLTLRVWIP